MSHPLTEQDIVDRAAGNPIPWSAEREFRLRRRITTLWFVMWSFLIAGMGIFTIAFLSRSGLVVILAVLSLVAGVFFLNALSVARANLGEEMRRGPRGEFFEGSGMLANKPRSTRGLTKWIQHSAQQFLGWGVKCDCGRIYELDQWKWVPNYPEDETSDEFRDSNVEIDPGGGRFVILCPCGIGHFKLKPASEQNVLGSTRAKHKP